MPTLARVYGIPPREQRELTLTQFHDLCRDFERLRQEADGH